jgi:hypothetical protein
VVEAIVLAPFKADIAFFTGETALTACYIFGTCLAPFPIYIIFLATNPKIFY